MSEKGKALIGGLVGDHHDLEVSRIALEVEINNAATVLRKVASALESRDSAALEFLLLQHGVNQLVMEPKLRQMLIDLEDLQTRLKEVKSRLATLGIAK